MDKEEVIEVDLEKSGELKATEEELLLLVRGDLPLRAEVPLGVNVDGFGGIELIMVVVEWQDDG